LKLKNETIKSFKNVSAIPNKVPIQKNNIKLESGTYSTVKSRNSSDSTNSKAPSRKPASAPIKKL
jgi:hypothetical protein